MIDKMDEFYDIVGREIASGNMHPGVMARALSDSGGEQGQARSLYIKYRVLDLIAEAEAAARTEDQRREQTARIAAAEQERIEHEARQRASQREHQRLIDLVEELGGLPHLLEHLSTSVTGLEKLTPQERQDSLLEWDDATEIYQIAHRLHYQLHDPDAAEPIYRFICSRFPDLPEHRYSATQLENIAVLTSKQRTTLAKKRDRR